MQGQGGDGHDQSTDNQQNQPLSRCPRATAMKQSGEYSGEADGEAARISSSLPLSLSANMERGKIEPGDKGGEAKGYRMSVLAKRKSASEARFRRLLADMNDSSQSIEILATDIEKSIRRQQQRKAMRDFERNRVDEDTVMENDRPTMHLKEYRTKEASLTPPSLRKALLAPLSAEDKTLSTTATTPPSTSSQLDAVVDPVSQRMSPKPSMDSGVGLDRATLTSETPLLSSGNRRSFSDDGGEEEDGDEEDEAMERRKRRYTTTQALLATDDSSRSSHGQKQAPTEPEEPKQSSPRQRVKSPKKKEKSKSKKAKKQRRKQAQQELLQHDTHQQLEEEEAEFEQVQQQQLQQQRAIMENFGSEYVMTGPSIPPARPTVVNAFASGYMVSPQLDSSRKSLQSLGIGMSTASSSFDASPFTQGSKKSLAQQTFSSSESGGDSGNSLGLSSPPAGMGRGRGRLGHTVVFEQKRRFSAVEESEEKSENQITPIPPPKTPLSAAVSFPSKSKLIPGRVSPIPTRKPSLPRRGSPLPPSISERVSPVPLPKPPLSSSSMAPPLGSALRQGTTTSKKKKQRSVMFAADTFLPETHGAELGSPAQMIVEDEPSISMSEVMSPTPSSGTSSGRLSSFQNSDYFHANQLNLEQRSIRSINLLDDTPPDTPLTRNSDESKHGTPSPSQGLILSQTMQTFGRAMTNFSDSFVVEADSVDGHLMKSPPPRSPPLGVGSDISSSQVLTENFVVVDDNEIDHGNETQEESSSSSLIHRPQTKLDEEERHHEMHGSSGSSQFGNILLVDPSGPPSSRQMGAYSDESGLSIRQDDDSAATPSTISENTAGRGPLGLRQQILKQREQQQDASEDESRQSATTATSVDRSAMLETTPSIQEQTKPLLRHQTSSLTISDGSSVGRDYELPMELTSFRRKRPRQSNSNISQGNRGDSTSPQAQRGIVSSQTYNDYVQPLGNNSRVPSLTPSIANASIPGSGDGSVSVLTALTDEESSLQQRVVPIARAEALAVVHESASTAGRISLRSGYASEDSLRQLSVQTGNTQTSLMDQTLLAQPPIVAESNVSLVYEGSPLWDAVAGSVVAVGPLPTDGSYSVGGDLQRSMGGSSRGGAWRDRSQRHSVMSAAASAATTSANEGSNRSGMNSMPSYAISPHASAHTRSAAMKEDMEIPGGALYPSEGDIEAAITDEMLIEKSRKDSGEVDEEALQELFMLYKTKSKEMDWVSKRQDSVEAVPLFNTHSAAAASQASQPAMKTRQEIMMPNAQILSVVEEPLPIQDMPSTYEQPREQEEAPDSWEVPKTKGQKKKRTLLPPRRRHLNFWARTAIVVVLVAVVVGLAGYFGVRFGVQDSSPPSGASPTASPVMPFDRESLKNSIIQFQPESENELNTQGTYASRALDWLVSDVNLSYSGDSMRLLRRFALAVFYYSMSGEMWTRQDGWMTASDECTWFTSATASCRDNGEFVILSLISNKLTGTRIPKQLALISELAWIDVSGNTLFDPFPEHLSRFPSLTSLFMASTTVSSTIPTDIGLFSNLEFLSLSKNFFFGSIPTEMGQISRLTWMDFSFNRITGSIPAEFSSLNSLSTVKLESNLLSGELPKDLNPAVRKLYLGGNKFNGTIPDWPSEFQFEELFLNNNFDVTGMIPSSLNAALSFDPAPSVDLRGTSLTGSVPNAVCEKVSETGGSLLFPCEQVFCAGECCSTCAGGVSSRVSSEGTFWNG